MSRRLIFSYQITQAITVAARLRIADHLDETPRWMKKKGINSEGFSRLSARRFPLVSSRELQGNLKKDGEGTEP